MTYDLPNIADVLEKVDVLRAEIDAMRPIEPEQLGRAMQRLRLEWTYHSNAIEGNSLTYGETVVILMEGLTAHGKPLKDALDIQRHGEVLTYLQEVVRGEEELSLKDIRGMHRMLMGEMYTVSVEHPDGSRAQREEMGGAFKEHPNSVLTPTDETHFYASPHETPALMQDLVDWYRETWPDVESGKIPAVPFVADFHHRFVQIHPFADCNGRMGRILMNLMLMKRGYVPAVLRQERRREYYGALNRANTGDLEPLVRFVAEELAVTMELFLSAVRGEPDPKEYGRRLALLKRKVDDQQLIDGVQDPLGLLSQLSVGYLAPIIMDIDEGVQEALTVFNSLKRTGRYTHISGLGNTLLSEGQGVAGGLPRSFLDGKWLNFRIFWTLEGFRMLPEEKVILRMEASVGSVVMVVHAGVTHAPVSRRVDIQLNSNPNADDVKNFSSIILSDLIDVIETFQTRFESPT